MFVNVSNHPSELWLDKQKECASCYGSIVDVAFPAIHKDYDSSKYDELVELYYERIMGALSGCCDGPRRVCLYI